MRGTVGCARTDERCAVEEAAERLIKTRWEPSRKDERRKRLCAERREGTIAHVRHHRRDADDPIHFFRSHVRAASGLEAQKKVRRVVRTSASRRGLSAGRLLSHDGRSEVTVLRSPAPLRMCRRLRYLNAASRTQRIRRTNEYAPTIARRGRSTSMISISWHTVSSTTRRCSTVPHPHAARAACCAAHGRRGRVRSRGGRRRFGVSPDGVDARAPRRTARLRTSRASPPRVSHRDAQTSGARSTTRDGLDAWSVRISVGERTPPPTAYALTEKVYGASGARRRQRDGSNDNESSHGLFSSRMCCFGSVA